MDELLASITRLEGDNVVRGLQAMLDQAQTALRPATKSSKNRPPAPPGVSSVDKRTLGRGILALLAHAAGGGGGADAVAAVAAPLAAALRSQPWLWEFFVRRHMSDLLQNPGALNLLTQALATQDAPAQGRGWAALATALRSTPVADLVAAPALSTLQQAALEQVSGCLRLVSKDLLPSAATGAAAPPAAAEIHVTPSPQLAAALDALLHLVVDVDGGSGQGPSLAAAGDASCVEGAAAYTSTLLAELCNPEAVSRMLQLGNLQERAIRPGSSDGSGAAVAATSEPRLSSDAAQRVHSTMQVATVLIEAVLMWPHLATGAGPGADGDAAVGPPTAQLAMTSSLLAVRWELAQLLSATGISGAKNMTKTAPPPWSLRTCLSLLSAAVVPGEAAGQPPALAMPPALVAHALELMHVALPTWPESKSAMPRPTESAAADGASAAPVDGEPALLPFLRQVLVVQEACYTGILTPHAAVKPGPGHQAAMSTARQLHALLLADPSVGGSNGNRAAVNGLSRLLDFPGAAGALGIGHQGTRKRGSGGAVAAAVAPKRRKKAGGGAAKGKGGGKNSAGDDAVADLMRLLAAPLPALPPESGGGDGTDGQETTAAPTSVATSAQNPTTSGPSNPSSSVAPPPLESAAPPAPSPEPSAPSAETAPNGPEKKPVKRRIVPQAMGPASLAPAPLDAAPNGDDASADAVGEDPSEGDVAAPEAHPTRGTFGRVVMGSSLDMDDAAREAMWSAYIADKERLVEMLGDSSYQEWYDEAAHPVPQMAKRGGGVDAAFDAVFGGAGEGGGGGDAGDDAFASSLPQTILETSLLYPWQAGLAAALNVVHAAAAAAAGAASAGETAIGAGDAIFGALASVDQRKASAAAVLKVIDPNHSRNVWLAASKGAEAFPASATLLHLISQLRTMLMRTSRRTAPPTLSAYLSLALAVLEVARREDTAAAAAAAAGPRKAPWLPLRHVGALVRSFFCYPPLMAASVDAVSSRALVRLAAVGTPPLDATGYAAAALWLVVQQRGGAAAAVQRPEWLNAFIPEASAYPLVAATPSTRATSAAELLSQLAAGVNALVGSENDEDDEEGSRHAVLLPAIDACAAAALRLAREQEPPADAAADAPPPLPTILVGNNDAETSLAALAAALCAACADSAEALGAALDSSGDPDSAALADLEDRASLLGLGLELTDAVELAAASGGATWAAASAALERAAGAQTSCMELLRSLPDDSPVYIAAVRGLETAPMLALPASPAADTTTTANAADAPEGSPGDATPARPSRSAYQRRKRLQDIQNPYLRVIVDESRRAAGEAADGDLSDLEDFIVANPERDYGGFIASHFPMAPDSEEDEEEEEEEGGGDEEEQQDAE